MIVQRSMYITGIAHLPGSTCVPRQFIRPEMPAETSSDEPTESADNAADAGSDEQWESWYEALRTFPADANGKRDVPQLYLMDDGRRLGKWYMYQRVKYKCGELSAERIARLEAAGIVWPADNSSWETAFSHFKSLKPNRSAHDSTNSTAPGHSLHSVPAACN